MTERVLSHRRLKNVDLIKKNWMYLCFKSCRLLRPDVQTLGLIDAAAALPRHRGGQLGFHQAGSSQAETQWAPLGGRYRSPSTPSTGIAMETAETDPGVTFPDKVASGYLKNHCHCCILGLLSKHLLILHFIFKHTR